MARLARTMMAAVLMVLAAALSAGAGPGAVIDGPAEMRDLCPEQQRKQGGGRLVCADLAAVDQTLVYNRFGSFNPFGMIFVLRRDLVPMDLGATAQPIDCAEDLGAATEDPDLSQLQPGLVRLRDCKRPRPLTLRANVGDRLLVRVTNYLAEPVPDFSSDFCGNGPGDDRNRAAVRPELSTGDAAEVAHGEALCDRAARPDAALAALPDWPATRQVNFVVQGLKPLPLAGQAEPDPACTGLSAVEPGRHFTCLYEITVEGTHFLASHAAPIGGEGDGGSITHGLFGAILAERPGTRWYRSQMSPRAFDRVWPAAPEAAGKPRHARTGQPDYERMEASLPLANMARMLDVPPVGGSQRDFRSAQAVEIVHADLNAVIYCDAESAAAQDRASGGCNARIPAPLQKVEDRYPQTTEPAFVSFREFSVFFHDELKTFYTRNFQELGQMGQLAGVRDGFAINYGASGMGAMLLANRKGIGPAASCVECLYEEFFLTSWANGDPALLEWFDDDPSNVHHSYMNDPVVFRNFHAGPKETHVFHLHAHQWFAGNDPSRGSYLDSQTVAPQQGFTYNIYSGGLNNGKGGWQNGGSGNRNRTVGDSIFHCHLYPHFAQGMWALWRVHDVLEDGTRKLPDGQPGEGLSVALRPAADLVRRRTGSVDEQGRWLVPDPVGQLHGQGTPIPALLPLPGEPLPLLPTYSGEATAASAPAAPAPASSEPAAAPATKAEAAPPRPLPHRAAAAGPERLFLAAETQVAPAPVTPPAPPAEVTAQGVPQPQPVVTSMPGYPFYIAGKAGHRPPQAPMDIARDEENAPQSGGLGRHVVEDGGREPGVHLRPEFLAAAEADFDPADPAAVAAMERLRAQIVAAALAMGDMTAELTWARISTLDLDGTALERAAMGFHHNGRVFDPGTEAAARPKLALADALGNPVAGQVAGGYASPIAPMPGAAVSMPPFRAVTQVNGAPPKPGAPFADPCGGAAARNGSRPVTDPLSGDAGPFFADRSLSGFRRYEVSAVQLDLIVNRIGWHDPQARIDVLSARSDDFKQPSGASPRPYSPTIKDDEEPFFFRALSGECIEFRHTNELPKTLELDDFQVRTPTDTIGQHIHLVKFDVTASDGSGNGWNYEDGTFAPDELLARRCAAAHPRGLPAGMAAGLSPGSGTTVPEAAECQAGHHDVWRRRLSENREDFQTTVQRWFADPLLTEAGKPEGAPVDRTLRTVFSHDHFGPSSIQQHGFYTALLIEPAEAVAGVGLTPVCDPADSRDCATTEPHEGGPYFVPASRQAGMVGTRKRIILAGPDDPTHPDYLEFAVSIADFATLYDPRDRVAETDEFGPEAKGMARLACELRHRRDPADLKTLCGSGGPEPAAALPGLPLEDIPPAWVAAGRLGDSHGPATRLDAIAKNEYQRLRTHLLDYRRAAAGMLGQRGRSLAQPVNPPRRPESISVDHHDPYLVNYRNAPLPLRIGTKNQNGSMSPDCLPFAMNPQRSAGGAAASGRTVVDALATGTFPLCSFTYQLASDHGGDAGSALSSWGGWNPNGVWQPDAAGRDPETPIFKAAQGERIMFRLIQGAQEVQHTFTVAGVPFRRNVDQIFPQGMTDRAQTFDSPRQACFEAVRRSRPREYDDWLKWTPADAEEGTPQKHDPAHFAALQQALAECDNIEGMTFAQEIGISEHFEMRGRLRADINAAEARVLGTPRPAPRRADPDGPQTGSRDRSDYLYHFGSLDALWNGAWGLVRISGKSGSGSEGPGGVRTREFQGVRTREFQDAAGCPLNGAGRVQTSALVVALRSDAVWGTAGTDYGNGLSDPDGLALALLPSDAFGGDISLDEDWDQLTREQVLDKVREFYPTRPEPFVMRANAGDCVVLRMVNLLPADGGADRLGDARMPAITPLNTDPPSHVTLRDGVTTRAEFGAWAAPGLRPSGRLALSVGLPGAELIRNLPLGFGLNREGLAGVSADGTVQVSEALSFYAGRMRLDLDTSANRSKDARDLANAVGDRITNALAAESSPGHWTGLLADAGFAAATGVSFEAAEAADRMQPYAISVLGADFLAFPDGSEKPIGADGGQGPLLDAIRAEVADEIDRHIHWVPYAFGAVPVRASGDVIGQVPHGLFGAIVVEPRDWPLDRATRVLRPGAGETAMLRTALPPAGEFGAPLDYDLRQGHAFGPGRRLREFVLFYQDGLNLRDRGSGLDWQRPGTDQPADPDEDSLGNVVPDCHVCDDSYDLGDAGVSYRSAALAPMLRRKLGRPVEASDDLNRLSFPVDLMAQAPLVLGACRGDQVLVRVLHPGGRARQRAFVMNSYGYDDLFPGFGFPNAALLAPGKSISAWITPAFDPDVSGLWHDGPTNLIGRGVWGRLAARNDCPAR